MMKRTVLLLFRLTLIMSIGLLALVIEINCLVGENRCRYLPDKISSREYCEDVLHQIYGTDLSADVTNNMINNTIDLEKSFCLYNFDDEPVAIFYKLKPVGYAIYDFAGEYVRQYSTDNDSDVFTDCEETYYYNGPYNYYVKTEEGFYNLWTGQIES